jgi:hypothetical protein
MSHSRLSAKLVPTFADRGCHVVSMTDPHRRNLGFLDFFFKVDPQLYSRGWVDPVPDRALFRKFGSTGNEPGPLDLQPLYHRAGPEFNTIYINICVSQHNFILCCSSQCSLITYHLNKVLQERQELHELTVILVDKPTLNWDTIFQLKWQTYFHKLRDNSKRALQWYSKCYCVASITKTFTLKGVQTMHRSRYWTMDSQE